MLAPAPLLIRDRLIGGLVGLVVGDALGVPVEFGGRGERDHDPVRGMRGFGTHHQPVGAWSDDGALAMAHAAAFVEHGWQPRRHLEAFLAWRDSGTWTAHGRAFDIGSATNRALERFNHGDAIETVGCRSVRDNGNGSLMRILPVSCWLAAGSAAEAVAVAGEASALTHAHARSRIACGWHALIVSRLLALRPLAGCLADAVRIIQPLTPEEERDQFAPLADASCLRLPRERVPSDGHVVSTLIAACWCLHRHDAFDRAVLEAVNLGHDTDTTAAVTGGLAGLRSGLTGIPRAWIACLPRRHEVLALAERFADACMAR